MADEFESQQPDANAARPQEPGQEVMVSPSVRTVQPLAPSPSSKEREGETDEESGMLRMSFMEHLEELRSRLLKALAGLVVAFLLSLTFCKDLWVVVAR